MTRHHIFTRLTSFLRKLGSRPAGLGDDALEVGKLDLRTQGPLGTRDGWHEYQIETTLVCVSVEGPVSRSLAVSADSARLSSLWDARADVEREAARAYQREQPGAWRAWKTVLGHEPIFKVWSIIIRSDTACVSYEVGCEDDLCVLVERAGDGTLCIEVQSPD